MDWSIGSECGFLLIAYVVLIASFCVLRAMLTPAYTQGVFARGMCLGGTHAVRPVGCTGMSCRCVCGCSMQQCPGSPEAFVPAVGHRFIIVAGTGIQSGKCIPAACVGSGSEALSAVFISAVQPCNLHAIVVNCWSARRVLGIVWPLISQAALMPPRRYVAAYAVRALLTT